MFTLNNAVNKFRSDIVFEIKYMIHCLLAKGTIVDFRWVPSHCGLAGNERADRIAKDGAFRHTLSHIDISLSTREIFTILENRMKTDLNLSNSSYLKGPRHLVSLIYRFRVNALKQSIVKISPVHAGKNYQPITFSVFNCHQFKILFRNSDLFSSSTTNTFPTDAL